MPDVPTADDAKDAGMTGLMTGGGTAVGEIAGRSILGAGLGTTVGGVLAASTMSGQSRDTAAALAVERGANELIAGAGTQGTGGQGVK